MERKTFNKIDVNPRLGKARTSSVLPSVYQTFGVVFFGKKAEITKKSAAPIYARITTSGQSTEIFTQCRIELQKWNQWAERSLSRDAVSLQINQIIAGCRAGILAAYDQLIKEGKEREERIFIYENGRQVWW